MASVEGIGVAIPDTPFRGLRYQCKWQQLQLMSTRMQKLKRIDVGSPLCQSRWPQSAEAFPNAKRMSEVPDWRRTHWMGSSPIFQTAAKGCPDPMFVDLPRRTKWLQGSEPTSPSPCALLSQTLRWEASWSSAACDWWLSHVRLTGNTILYLYIYIYLFIYLFISLYLYVHNALLM